MYAYRAGEEWLQSIAFDNKNAILYASGYDCTITTYRAGMTVKAWLWWALNPWRKGAEEIRMHYAKVKRFGSRLANRLLSMSWSRLLEWHEDLMDQRELTRKTLVFFLRRGLCMGYNKWRYVYEEERRQKGAAINKWLNRYLSMAWNKWYEIAMIFANATRFLKKMLHASMMASFNKWLAVQAAGKLALLARVVGFWSHRSMIGGWNRWREWHSQCKHAPVGSSAAIDVVLIPVAIEDSPLSPRNLGIRTVDNLLLAAKGTGASRKSHSRTTSPLSSSSSSPLFSSGRLEKSSAACVMSNAPLDVGHYDDQNQERIIIDLERSAMEQHEESEEEEEDRGGPSVAAQAAADDKEHWETGQKILEEVKKAEKAERQRIKIEKAASLLAIEASKEAERQMTIDNDSVQFAVRSKEEMDLRLGSGSEGLALAASVPLSLSWEKRALPVASQPAARDHLQKASSRLDHVGIKLSFESVYSIWSNTWDHIIEAGLDDSDKELPPISLKAILQGFTAMHLGYGELHNAWKQPGALPGPRRMIDLRVAFTGDLADNYSWTGKKALLTLQERLEGGPEEDDEGQYEFTASQVRGVCGYDHWAEVPLERLMNEFDALLLVLQKMDTADHGATTKGLLRENPLKPKSHTVRKPKPIPLKKALDRPWEHHFHTMRSPHPATQP